MTKKYNSPMLQVVRMKNNDIVTISKTEEYDENYETLAPGQRNAFDSWYEGY